MPILMSDNRSYRYGDGLFETIKVVNGKLQLGDFHFERLFNSMDLLKMNRPAFFSQEKITENISRLNKKNGCFELGRVRLSVFRGNGGLYEKDQSAQYLIECWPLDKSTTYLNNNGLLIDIYSSAVKTCDALSNIKSANFIAYALGAIYAKEQKLNDCLLLNTYGNVADATIANVFIIQNGSIITPSLDQGCVNGVMRRWMLQQLPAIGFRVIEKPVTIDDLEKSDEIFLTNAVSKMRWVKQFRQRTYTNVTIAEVFNRLGDPAQ